MRGFFQNGLACVDDDGFARTTPHSEIGGRISCVIEAAFAKLFRERFQFVFASQILFAVAAQHLVEKADVMGDRQRHLQIGRGGENELSSGGFLFTQKREKFFVKGQRGGINFDASDKLFF